MLPSVDIPKKLSSLVGLDETSELYSLIDVGLSLAPYIGKVWQFVKFNRLERRVNEHQAQFLRINQLMHDTILSADYIKERIFPIVFEDLLEEHEDSKVNYILNGFQNIFREEKADESLVINYFDTLRELRYADIRRFFYFCGLDSDFPESRSEDNEALKKSIEQKLFRLGLINFITRWDDNEGLDLPRSKDDVTLSLFGRNFLRFVNTTS
ncbi:hypothetical protein [Brevibacillus brevis]|uniref:hypothetical protein n=1 Tax=Brevibacillus brevis TaxID=1393 RepID=UPI001C8DE6AA|nr:hypothetical protein [Brevibacillus brevis]MBY0088103.1 hypothetical protein [Brevibacillus brevis]